MKQIDRYCCCQIIEDVGVLGEKRIVVHKCWPRAMDMGHCADRDNGTEDGTVPSWCCKSSVKKIP